MNPIEEMRERMTEQFTGAAKPLKGLGIFRVTANDMPRTPQSNLPSQRLKHDRVGRPRKKETHEPPLYRKKPDIFGGWL